MIVASPVHNLSGGGWGPPASKSLKKPNPFLSNTGMNPLLTQVIGT